MARSRIERNASRASAAAFNRLASVIRVSVNNGGSDVRINGREAKELTHGLLSEYGRRIGNGERVAFVSGFSFEAQSSLVEQEAEIDFLSVGQNREKRPSKTKRTVKRRL